MQRTLIAAALLAAAPVLAHAQYAGPTARPAASVQQILEAPEDGQQVRLRGHLLRKTGSEEYIFSDGTAEIIAEIDDDEFEGLRVDDKTRVELVGEVDTGRSRPPEIEVDKLHVIE